MHKTQTRSISTALNGRSVVELGERVGAGVCGGLLAHLGASVVLVEPSQQGTAGKWRTRSAIAFGKKTIVLDQQNPEDVATLDGLLATADIVLLSSDRSGFELDYWESSRPPGQIVCDITAFGHSGPLSGKGLSESLVQAYSGVADTMGPRDRSPSLIGAPLLDMETAVYAASAILAALRVLRVQGFGQRIDMSLYDVGVNALLTFVPLYLTGKRALRNGNRHPTLSPWNSYRANDGWVIICGPTDDQWKRICDAMGRPELALETRFASTTARMENVDEIDRQIAAWASGMTVAECVERLSKHSIPCGPILDLEALPDDENLKHRKSIRRVHDAASGNLVFVPANPLDLLNRDNEIAAIAEAGSDRDEILDRISGSAACIDEAVTRTPLPGTRPLQGVRVVEIGMNTVAPLACRQMGALGADVIKIEPPSGDTNRWNAPLRRGDGSYVFALSNTDKRGLILDLKQQSDKRTLLKLLESADILIENLKPGSLDRLGLGADDLCAQFPSLVYCSVSGFGHDSVFPGRPALDTVIQGMSGVMSASIIDGLPTKAGISISDQLGGQFGLLGMLAALANKEGEGVGARLDFSMQDFSAWATHILWNGAPRESEDVRIWRCMDGHVAIQGDDHVVFAALVGNSTATSLAYLLDQMQRDEIVGGIESLATCSAAPVLSVSEVLNHPQVAARKLFFERAAVDGGAWAVLGSPLVLEMTPAEVRHPMPRFGFVDPSLTSELGLDCPSDEPRQERSGWQRG